MTYDFAGWATRNNLRCSDGRTIMHDAFKECDGETVPLVWNHDHKEPENVLGHALLENRDDGVYAYCTFNDTKRGEIGKTLVKHGDITSLSIYANKLKEMNGNVYHGLIREVSLVHAGANPGAYIEDVMVHAEDEEGYGAIIYSGFDFDDTGIIEHAEEDTKVAEESKSSGKTIKEVFDAMTEEQKAVVYALVGMAAQDKGGEAEHSDFYEGEDEMKHNVFDSETDYMTGYDDGGYISHADQEMIIADANRYGSLKESALQHGITDIDYLFPEPKLQQNPPEWIDIKTDWVSKVMNGVHHTPYSRLKSQYADIRGDEARALGYIKGNYKKEEVFTLLKRTTQPTTVYKKQKFDRDDIVDITDFDVISWVKTEMRVKLDQELARAFLIGDGRNPSSDDKIKEDCIRPIWKDDDFYTIKYKLSSDKPVDFIRGAIKSRIEYRGSGSPTLFISEEKLTDLLLMTDATGRDLYDSEQKLATKMRVSSIVTLPQFSQNLVRHDSNTGKNYILHGLIVNLADYNVGADKGGAVNMFDDFDIDYNKMTYLIETRCSGSLTKPFSAIALETEYNGNVNTTNGTATTDDTDGE